MKKTLFKDENGFALVTALLMSAVIMIMAAAVLYFLAQSTTMSGAGKRYATAEAAADGVIQNLKDAITQINRGDDMSSLIPTSNCTDQNNNPQSYNLTQAVQVQNQLCKLATTVPGTIGTYSVEFTVEFLYSLKLAGSSMKFAHTAGAPPSNSLYYRITSKVVGPNNETAENAALYRYTQ